MKKQVFWCVVSRFLRLQQSVAEVLLYFAPVHGSRRSSISSRSLSGAMMIYNYGSGGKRPVPDSGDGNAGNHQRSTGTSLWFSLLKFEGEFID